MNTTDRIDLIRHHLTVLAASDNDAPRLVAEVVQDFPTILNAITQGLGDSVTELERQLNITEENLKTYRDRINDASAILTTKLEGDED